MADPYWRKFDNDRTRGDKRGRRKGKGKQDDTAEDMTQDSWEKFAEELKDTVWGRAGREEDGGWNNFRYQKEHSNSRGWYEFNFSMWEDWVHGHPHTRAETSTVGDRFDSRYKSAFEEFDRLLRFHRDPIYRLQCAILKRTGRSFTSFEVSAMVEKLRAGEDTQIERVT